MRGDGGMVNHAFNHVGDEFGDGKYFDFGGTAFERDGVGHDHFIEGGIFNVFQAVAGEEGVCTHRIDGLGTKFLHSLSCFAERAAGVNDIIKKK